MIAESFLMYNLKVAVCLVVFYLFYKILLSRETFHKLNRFLLIFGSLSAFIIPLCRITIYTEVSESSFFTLDELTMTFVEPDRRFPWTTVLMTAYFIGCFMFLCIMIYSMLRVKAISRRGREIILPYGITLVLTPDDITPFSCVKTIVVSESDYEKNGYQILTHEYAHINGYHSVDLLLFNILCCLQWFNPSIYLLKNELCAVHEYDADATVLRKGIDAKQYQLLLIEKAVGTKWYSIANSFNHSNLKNRITMMLKKKSSNRARAKALYVLPLICLELLLFAQTACVSGLNAKDTKKTETLVSVETKTDTTILEKDEKTLSTATSMPQFPGGTEALMQYLSKNIEYPVSARDAGIQGNVITQFTVDKDGSVIKESIKILRSVDENLDKEAMRVILSMPKWIPGMENGEPVKANFVLPITFAM